MLILPSESRDQPFVSSSLRNLAKQENSTHIPSKNKPFAVIPREQTRHIIVSVSNESSTKLPPIQEVSIHIPLVGNPSWQPTENEIQLPVYLPINNKSYT